MVYPLLLSVRACDTSSSTALLFAGEIEKLNASDSKVLHPFCRSACYGVLRFVMESGAKGCEVVVSGKLRAARAKSMKFTDGFMIHSGQPARDFVDYAVRHVLLRQGVLGIKVKMYAFLLLHYCTILNYSVSMKGHDPNGETGPRKPLPDSVKIHEPPIDKVVLEPSSETREPVSVPVAAQPEESYAPAEPAFEEPSYTDQHPF